MVSKNTNKSYKKIELLLDSVVGQIQEMNDDSNLYVNDLEKLTNMIRNAGANQKQMKQLINLGQCCINDTDDAIFVQAYNDGAKFKKYANHILDTINAKQA